MFAVAELALEAHLEQRGVGDYSADRLAEIMRCGMSELLQVVIALFEFVHIDLDLGIFLLEQFGFFFLLLLLVFMLSGSDREELVEFKVVE